MLQRLYEKNAILIQGKSKFKKQCMQSFCSSNVPCQRCIHPETRATKYRLTHNSVDDKIVIREDKIQKH